MMEKKEQQKRYARQRRQRKTFVISMHEHDFQCANVRNNIYL